MKKLLFAIFATAILSTTFFSCGKYEEGPKISLASKKSRLEGEWKLEKAMHNESDETSFVQDFWGANFTWEIEKDGKYKITGNFPNEGTWKLGEDKDDITFTPSSSSGMTSSTYRILRLTSKEFWIKQTQSNGDVDEYQLKQ